DVVVFPCASLFVDDPTPVWRECARVLRAGGMLLAGHVQPHTFLFDDEGLSRGELRVAHALPYSDVVSGTPDPSEPLVFGHTLESLLGAQRAAGLATTALYEARWPNEPLDDRIATFVATRAVKR